MNIERIVIIEDEDKCSVCRRTYAHRRVIKPSNIIGLRNVELIVSCPRCRALLRSKQEFEHKLLELEWKLFGLKHTTYFDE